MVTGEGCVYEVNARRLPTLVVGLVEGNKAMATMVAINNNNAVGSTLVTCLCCQMRGRSNDREVRLMRRISTSAPFVARMG
jgi:hypothetical protein